MSRFLAKCFYYLPCQPYSEVDRISRQKFPETDYYKPTEDSNGVILISEEALTIFEGTDEVDSYEEFEENAKEGVEQLDRDRNCCESAPVLLMVSRQFFNSITPWQVTDRGFALQKREINLYLQCETFKFATRICVDCDSGDLPENYGEIDEETGKLYVVPESEATPLSKALDLLRPQLQKAVTNLANFNSIWASFPHLTNIDWQVDDDEIEDFIDTFTKFLKHNKNPAFFASLIESCASSFIVPEIIEYEERLVTLVADIRRKKFLTFLQEKIINVIKNHPQHFEKCLVGFTNVLVIGSFFAPQQLADADWEQDDPGRPLNFPNDTKFERDDPYLSEIDFYHNKPLLSIQQRRPTPIAVLDPILDYLDAIVRNGDLHRLPFGAQQQIAIFYDVVSCVVLNTSEKRKDFILGDCYDGGTLLKEMLQSLMKQFKSFIERQQSIPSDLIDAIARSFTIFSRFLGDRFWVENIPLRNSYEHLPAMIQNGRKILAHFPFQELKTFIQHLPSITHEDEYQIIDGQRFQIGLSNYAFDHLCESVRSLVHFVLNDTRAAVFCELVTHKYNPLLIESGVIEEWFEVGGRCLFHPNAKIPIGRFNKLFNAIHNYHNSFNPWRFFEFHPRFFAPFDDFIRSLFVAPWVYFRLFYLRFLTHAQDHFGEILAQKIPECHQREVTRLEQIIRNDFRKRADYNKFSASEMDRFLFTTACKVHYLKKHQRDENIERAINVVAKFKETVEATFLRWARVETSQRTSCEDCISQLNRLQASLEAKQHISYIGDQPKKEDFFEETAGIRRDREGDGNSSAGN